MEIMYLLVPVSVVLVFLIAAIFWWSLRSGQFEDLEGPGYRILMDDDRPQVISVTAGIEAAPSSESVLPHDDAAKVVGMKEDLSR